ncbi:hypothetical protein ACQ9BO_13080 [Flavobacterium sp. P21]|uniref:hypothetical protein n=1 Tax=Flavobacterium sp. P21 TaxID=3423948 RepID=UPI003D671D94
MMIRYFIVFSPDGNGNPGLIFVEFFGVKERPAEAPFMPLKNNKYKEELQCTAGLASKN